MDIGDQIARQLKAPVLSWVKTWHASQSVQLPMAVYNSPYNNTTDGVTLFTATINRALTVVSWYQAIYVGTTNNASNYWTIELKRYTTTGLAIASLRTNRNSAGAWFKLDVEVGASVPSTDKFLFVGVSKTGSPGGLYLAGPAVYVR